MTSRKWVVVVVAVAVVVAAAVATMDRWRPSPEPKPVTSEEWREYYAEQAAKQTEENCDHWTGRIGREIKGAENADTVTDLADHLQAATRLFEWTTGEREDCYDPDRIADLERRDEWRSQIEALNIRLADLSRVEYLRLQFRLDELRP